MMQTYIKNQVTSFQGCLEKWDSIQSFTKGILGETSAFQVMALLLFQHWNVLCFEEYVLIIGRKTATLQEEYFPAVNSGIF